MKKYKHYIAVDWSQKNMAVARMTAKSSKADIVDVPTSISDLKTYLKNLAGSKILTIEESSTSQWLYTELSEHVDELIICNPLRNRLLSYGPKNDMIDAGKLVLLLRNNLLKPVYHSGSEYFQLRKLASGYASVIKNGVRLKNQRAALLISKGKNKKEKQLTNSFESFVLDSLDNLIKNNDEQVNKFVHEFKRLKKNNKIIKNLVSIPGIQERLAVKLLAIVIDPKRFADKGKWLSYCGLIKHEKISGGRSYGKRSPQYSREAKSIFKIAAMVCITVGGENNVFRRYYNQLLQKGIAEHNARHAVARRIAIIALGILKSGKPFEDRWEVKNNKK